MNLRAILTRGANAGSDNASSQTRVGNRPQRPCTDRSPAEDADETPLRRRGAGVAAGRCRRAGPVVDAPRPGFRGRGTRREGHRRTGNAGGTDGQRRLHRPSKIIGDADLSCLPRPERTISASSSIRPACRARARYLEYAWTAPERSARWVSLGSCPVTDDGLKNLPVLPRLEFSKPEPDARDRRRPGPRGAMRQKSLRHLFLCHTAVTDAGLEHLKGYCADQLGWARCHRERRLTQAGVR